MSTRYTAIWCPMPMCRVSGKNSCAEPMARTRKPKRTGRELKNDAMPEPTAMAMPTVTRSRSGSAGITMIAATKAATARAGNEYRDMTT